MHTAWVFVLVFSLAAVPAQAAGCGNSPYTVVLQTPDAVMGVHYVMYDPGCDPECHSMDFAVYEESNGIPGLQRDPDFNAWHGQLCDESIEPDTWLLI